jgi:hypothetical protein
VHPALVRERIAPDVGLVGIGCEVEQLIDEVRCLSQQRELVVLETVVAELQLEVGDDRHQVGVAGPLAVAVHGALDMARANLNRGDRVSDAALRVVVTVDSDAHVAIERRRGRACRGGDLRRQRRSVGVAEHDRLGPGFSCRSQTGDRVVGLGAPAVEEVLGVVDHPLALAAQEIDRVGDHPQVLGAVDLDEFLEVERPRLADDRADRRDGLREQRKGRIGARAHVTPTRHSEGSDLRVGKAL